MDLIPYIYHEQQEVNINKLLNNNSVKLKYSKSKKNTFKMVNHQLINFIYMLFFN
jgi:hypothetical protein